MERIFCIIGLFVLFGCTEPQRPDDIAKITQQKIVKLGTIYGPTTYYIGTDGPKGLEYELAKGFADYLGVELQVFPFYSYQELLPQLANGQMDIVATGQVTTTELTQQFISGPAYEQVDLQLIYHKRSPRPRDLNNLDGLLMVVAHSSHDSVLNQLKAQNNALQWRTTDESDQQELLEMVASGELTYTIADSNIVDMLRRRYPDLSIAFNIAAVQPVSWLLTNNGDDSIRAALLEYFGTLQQSGKLAMLEEKYYGHVRSFDYVDTLAFMDAVETVLPTYRPVFEQHANNVDWRLLAAMSYQESHWKPHAVSKTGVVGMMMLTVETASDMNVTNREDPQQSIRGGATYFASLLSRIPARIPSPDRVWMALAAYNIGLGHLEDARVLTQRQGGSPDVWLDVKQRLPQLKQKKYYRLTRYGFARGDEALHYVENIRRYYDTLIWLDEQAQPSTEKPVTQPNTTTQTRPQ